MFYTDLLFIFYFLPVALLIYWALPTRAQNYFLLFASLVFYAWGDLLLLVTMAVISVINHLSGSMIERSDDVLYRKRIVRHAVILTVLVLLLVLYGHHVVNTTPGTYFPLPLGISFYALQGMTYVFEIARGKARAERSIVDTALFIAFLPTVVAGPILRYSDLAGQLRERTITQSLFGLGCERVVVGIGKLLILAVPLGNMATAVFDRSAAGNQFNTTPVMLAWLGVFAFMLQYYLTLSGIADIAIGLARLFGFSLRENFRYPYTARSIAAFWSRWHISLYRWFFVYVFLALGGRRARMVRIHGALRPRNFVLRNSFVLWVLIGLWHGIGWSNLFFGIWFFIFTFFEWVVSFQRRPKRSMLWTVYVLLVVAVGWVFLRCYSFSDSINYFSNLIGVNGNGIHSDFAVLLLRENWLPLVLAVLASTPIGRLFLVFYEKRRGRAVGSLLVIVRTTVLILLACLCFIHLGTGQPIPPFLFR